MRRAARHESRLARQTSAFAGQRSRRQRRGETQTELHRPAVQIGAASDPLERQADNIAETIIAGGYATNVSAAPGKGSVQRKCADCEAADDQKVRLTSAGSPASASAGDGGAAAAAVGSGGRPLPSPLRSYFEPRFGGDLSSVRLHTHAQAAGAASAIGARAYTYGQDIAFAPGAYAPGTIAGRRLIAHELAHVAQQRCGAMRIQRETPAAAKPVADPELDLGNALRGLGFSAGFTLAFYDQNEPEAERRAGDFAKRENAIGIKGTTVSAANLVFGKAISGVNDVDTTVPAIAKTANDALARVPPLPSYPPATAAAPGKVRAIAIFAHGTNDWCSLGITVSNAPRIFKAIAPNLASTVRVILYTCSSARGSDEDEEWVKGTMRGGGKGSLASTVRDVLAEEKVDAASVWGHTTVGHVSRNFALREFTARAGKGAEGESYAATYVFTDTERTKAIDELATEINGKGYKVSAADAPFVAAASTELEQAFYFGYAAANAKLTGDNVAEEAPLYPYMTASRVVTYWNDTYWPANRAKVADKVIRRMKLKKP